MSPIKKVTFWINTKPPNNGKNKITTRLANDTIEIIMSQTGSTREVAMEAYYKSDGDLIDSLMYIDKGVWNIAK